jgi:hypothetical protein
VSGVRTGRPIWKPLAAWCAAAVLVGAELAAPARGAVPVAPGTVLVAQAGPRCQVETAALAATGTVRTRAVPYFVEVELMLANKGHGPLRLDPARFTLVSDQGSPVGAASRDDVVYALRTATSPSVGVYGIFHSGSFGVAVGLGPFALQNAAIESRLLKAGDLAPGASVSGSVYFRPAAWPGQFSVRLEGVTAESGAALPPVELRNCQMPFRPAEAPIGFATTPGLQTIEVSARAEAGPIRVSVSGIQFIKDATTLVVTVDNAAATPAELFMAIADARLVDETGKAYPARVMRSDLPNRVEARSQARGLLVFEPLPHPPAVTSARLILPGIEAGGVLYSIEVDLRF